jgi:hypothetical protein
LWGGGVKGRTLIFFNPHGWHACDTRLRGGGVDIALDAQLSENLRHAVVFGVEEVGDLEVSSDV